METGDGCVVPYAFAGTIANASAAQIGYAECGHRGSPWLCKSKIVRTRDGYLCNGAPAIPCGKRRMVSRKLSRPGRIRNGFRIRRSSSKRAGRSAVCRNAGASKRKTSPCAQRWPPSPTSPVKFAAHGAGRTGAALRWPVVFETAKTPPQSPAANAGWFRANRAVQGG